MYTGEFSMRMWTLVSERPRGLYGLFKGKHQEEHKIVVSDAFSKILIFITIIFA